MTQITHNRAISHGSPDSATQLELLEDDVTAREYLESEWATYRAELKHYLEIGDVLQAACLRGKLMGLAYQRRRERHIRSTTVEELEWLSL